MSGCVCVVTTCANSHCMIYVSLQGHVKMINVDNILLKLRFNLFTVNFI